VNGVALQLSHLHPFRVGVSSVNFSVVMLVAADLVTCRPLRTAHRMIRPVSPLLWSVQLVIRQTTEAELCASERKISCILRLRGVCYSVSCCCCLVLRRPCSKTDRQAGDICKMRLSSGNFCVFLPTAS
jgi:hypothetical protein